MKTLLERAREKAAAAKAILEGEDPNVEEANKLLTEAKALQLQAKALQDASDLVADADKAIADRKALEDAPPTNSGGIVVVEDETDKKAKGKKWSMGEFLIGISNGDRLVQPFRSNEVEKGAYDMSKALGPDVIGSMSDTKAITGLSESVPVDGGILVGTDRSGSIMSRTYNVGNLLQRVDMVGIGPNSNGMVFFAEDESSRKAGSRRGGIQAFWAAEAAEKTKSKPKFRELELKLNKVIGLVYATDELLADAQALESWIMTNLPEELRFVVEDSIINGTNAGMPLGILQSLARITVPAEIAQAATTIVSENVINMYARRYLGGRNYIWLAHQDIAPQLMQLNLGAGTGGMLVYMPPGGLSVAPFATLLGLPVVEIEYAQTLGQEGDLMLVSMSEYQMIDKGGVQSASSIHVRFVFDESVFRFVLRIDGEPKWDQPLTPFHGTNTVSPFITLAERV